MKEKAVERRARTREFRGSRCQKEKHNSLEDKYVWLFGATVNLLLLCSIQVSERQHPSNLVGTSAQVLASRGTIHTHDRSMLLLSVGEHWFSQAKVGCYYQKKGVEAGVSKTTNVREPDVRNLASPSPWRDLWHGFEARDRYRPWIDMRINPGSKLWPRPGRGRLEPGKADDRRGHLEFWRVSSCIFWYSLHPAASTENAPHGQWNGMWGRHQPLRSTQKPDTMASAQCTSRHFLSFNSNSLWRPTKLKCPGRVKGSDQSSQSRQAQIAHVGETRDIGWAREKLSHSPPSPRFFFTGEISLFF